MTTDTTKQTLQLADDLMDELSKIQATDDYRQHIIKALEQAEARGEERGEARGREEERRRYSPLRAIVKRFYEDAREYEEYTFLAEVDAMAFHRDTGIWPPGKSAPAEMHLEPIEERQKAFDEWCKSVDELIGYKP